MKERLFAVGLIILFCIQSMIYIYNKKNATESLLKPVIEINNQNRKSFSQFFQDMNNIENCNIKNINKNKDDYSANLIIRGNKEEISLGLKSLNGYNIKGYKLNIIESEIIADIDIVYKL